MSKVRRVIRRCFHLLGRKARRPETVVVIWGLHSPDWMHALAPEAPVWKAIPQVQAVLQFSRHEQYVPLGIRWGRRIVVIPLMESHIAERPTHYAALVPTMRALDIFSDKARFSNYVESHGLAAFCPTTYGSIEDTTFPCVIKRTNLNAGQGVEIAASVEQARTLGSREPFVGHPYVVQAMVPCTVQYVVHCVCSEGRIIWHVVYAYDLGEHQILRANYLYALRRATISEPLLREVEAFLAPLAYSGPCSVDCTWRDDGRLVVFEINPRLGGSLMRPENTGDLASCLSSIIAGAIAAG